jgi:transposase InsO family protein
MADGCDGVQILHWAGNPQDIFERHTDLYDRRIVAYSIGDHNDNRLVFDTFDAAMTSNPNAHPLFHSDRGFQYTSRSFHLKLQAARMKQSMSRVAHCIDNGPMEGFWGILKREINYGYKFTSGESIQAISDYIYFYNYQRLQCRLRHDPMEFHEQYARPHRN